MNDTPNFEHTVTMRWYVATVVMSCVINGEEINPFMGAPEHKSRPYAVRKVYLVEAADAESAYNKALAFGKEAEYSVKRSETELEEWIFAGLEDLQELGDKAPGDGTEIWWRSTLGLPSVQFVRPKEALSIFDEWHSWICYPPEQYWPKPSKDNA